jgi:putative flavoprotein involved in K+ transport
MANFDKKFFDTIVVGAGQAGLATGYYLKKNEVDFAILDASEYVGEVWNERWDSLRLFTPSQYNSLPGLLFPGKKGTFPSKTEMGSYLNRYAEKFELPVYLKKKVIKIKNHGQCDFEVVTDSESIFCNNLVIATGGNQKPNFPFFRSSLNDSVFKIHSSEYKKPQSIPQGEVLVVGVGTSGVQIAIDLSKTHKVYLSGKPTFHIPDFIFKYFGRFYWWFINNILTINTPMGRKAREGVLTGGAPLINVSMKDAFAAGVELLPRVDKVDGDQLKFVDGTKRKFKNIVFATGFSPDYSWLDIKFDYELGWPKNNRGISSDRQGLYFVGMIFQFGLTSAIIGGVGRDAKYVCDTILKRRKA